MLGYLAGVPGRLKALTDRLSATWAAKLDTLHTLWTATLAARIDTTISSRATPADVATAVATLGPLLRPPLAGGMPAPVQFDAPNAYALSLLQLQLSNDACGAAADTWEDVINVAGAGHIAALISYNRAPVGANTHTVEVIVDGESRGTSANAYNGVDYRFRPLAGLFGRAPVHDAGSWYDSAELKAPEAIVYTTSLQVRQKRSNTSSVSCGVYFRHWRAD